MIRNQFLSRVKGCFEQIYIEKYFIDGNLGNFSRRWIDRYIFRYIVR